MEFNIFALVYIHLLYTPGLPYAQPFLSETYCYKETREGKVISQGTFSLSKNRLSFWQYLPITINWRERMKATQKSMREDKTYQIQML
jgi:hypothetical protein